MPSEILKRALFQASNTPLKKDSGIMQGFDDEDEDEEENDEMMEEINQRSVKSPEILMNNLRGDMRSVDARYKELADMVGEEAAMETPPEVLAMLQPQLSEQEQPSMGIGALPSQEMPPPSPLPGEAPMPTPLGAPQAAGISAMVPPDMMPPPMEGQEMMPPPQGFAYGGMVGSAPGYGPLDNTVTKEETTITPPMYQAALNSSPYQQPGEVDSRSTYGETDSRMSQTSPFNLGPNQPFTQQNDLTANNSFMAPMGPSQEVVEPQGYAQGGAVMNPSHGIQQFKSGGLVQRITEVSKNNPVHGFLNTKRGVPVGAAPAETPPATVAPPPAETPPATVAPPPPTEEELRKIAINTPTVLDEKTQMQVTNPAFLNEFARRFAESNLNPTVPKVQLANTPQYMLGGNLPLYAHGGVVNIPQANANYTKGTSRVKLPGDDIPQSGAVYTKSLVNAGRNGDSMLVHMSQSQADLLKFMGGAGSKNPKTGLPEYFTEDEDVDTMSTQGAGATGSYSPEVVSQARSYMDQFLNQKPTPVPSLEEGIKARQPIYSRLLGGEDQKQMSQARILFDIAQRGLNFAANVDDQGRPIRGSGVQRFARSFSTLPTAIGQETKYMDEVERAARLAAFQATEKEIEATRAANIKLIEGQRKAFADILKSDGGGAFGKSLTGRIANMFSSDLVTKFAKGQTSPDQDRQFLTAVTQYTQPTESRDPVTGNIILRKPELPGHVALALQTRNLKPVDMVSGEDKKSAIPAPKIGEIPTTKEMSERSVEAAPAEAPTQPRTMWAERSKFAGPVPVVASKVAKVPGFGDLAPEMQQAIVFVDTAKRDLIKNLQNNPRFPEGERKAIEKEIDIGANFIDNPAAVGNRMIALDDFLFKRQQNEERAAQDNTLPSATRQAALQAANELRNFRVTMGVPPRMTSIEQVKALPSGTRFIWQGQERIRE